MKLKRVKFLYPVSRPNHIAGGKHEVERNSMSTGDGIDGVNELSLVLVRADNGSLPCVRARQGEHVCYYPLSVVSVFLPDDGVEIAATAPDESSGHKPRRTSVREVS